MPRAVDVMTMNKPPLPPRANPSSLPPSLATAQSCDLQQRNSPHVPPPIPQSSKPRITPTSQTEKNTFSRCEPHTTCSKGGPRLQVEPSREIITEIEKSRAALSRLALKEHPAELEPEHVSNHTTKPALPIRPKGQTCPPSQSVPSVVTSKYAYHISHTPSIYQPPTVESDTTGSDCLSEKHDKPSTLASGSPGPNAKTSNPPSHLSSLPNQCFYTTANLPCNGQFDHADEYFIGKECPNSENLAFNAFWFACRQAPDFLICSRCFEFHVRGSCFEPSFDCKIITGNTPAARCSFGVPRMIDILWPEAIQSGNIQQVEDYMKSRVTFPTCHGTRGVTGPASSGLKWYEVKNDAIPGFVACEACHHGYIIGSDFESRFTLRQVKQRAEDTWACDIALPYVQRALDTYCKTRSWLDFVTAVTHRLSRPLCQGLIPVKASSRKWYKAGEFLVCEACYFDKTALTVFDHKFRRVNVKPNEQDADLRCEFAISSLDISFLCALLHSNYDVFWNTVQCQLTMPLCSKEGFVGGIWYTLKDGCENFDVCKVCYTGLICSTGLQNEFQEQRRHPAGSTITCDFCTEAPRFSSYFPRFDIAVNTPDTGLFSSYVKRVAHLPLCRGPDAYESRWYSCSMVSRDSPMQLCQSCFEDTMRGNPLEHTIRLEDTLATSVCEMYSANMRTRWAAVVQASIAEAKVKGLASAPVAVSRSALADFAAYRNHRMSIYLQTIPEIKKLLVNSQLRLGQQRMLNMQSSFYNNLDRTTATAQGIHYGPTPTYQTVYGNSSLGYHWETPWGVEGAQYAQQANALAGSNSGHTVRMAYLNNMWREFE